MTDIEVQKQVSIGSIMIKKNEFYRTDLTPKYTEGFIDYDCDDELYVKRNNLQETVRDQVETLKAESSMGMTHF